MGENSSAMDFHHLGIATHDVEATAERFCALLDCAVAHSERFDGIAIRFLELDGGYLELLEPLTHDALSRFLDRRGPGVHHVGFATTDIDRALARALEHGVELIDDSPRPGAWGHEVAFLHPDSTGGVLIEFVAPADESG